MTSPSSRVRVSAWQIVTGTACDFPVHLRCGMQMKEWIFAVRHNAGECGHRPRETAGSG